MKKILTFIPLGIGISATIIYIINILRFRVIGSGATMMQILASLKIYLYVAIGGFAGYFFIRLLVMINDKHKFIEVTDEVNENDEKNADEYQSNVSYNTVYNQPPVTRYDYNQAYEYNPNTPNMYDANNFNTNGYHSFNVNETTYNHQTAAFTSSQTNEELEKSEKYCFKCGSKINADDVYCSTCGTPQKRDKQKLSPFLKSVINVLEIVILLLIIYFSLNMLFDYKESKDSSFKSPFKVRVMK